MLYNRLTSSLGLSFISGINFEKIATAALWNGPPTPPSIIIANDGIIIVIAHIYVNCNKLLNKPTITPTIPIKSNGTKLASLREHTKLLNIFIIFVANYYLKQS